MPTHFMIALCFKHYIKQIHLNLNEEEAQINKTGIMEHIAFQNMKNTHAQVKIHMKYIHFGYNHEYMQNCNCNWY